MNIFGNPTGSGDSDRLGRLVRLVGRALLWGCVVLLLVRGLITTLGIGATRVVTTTSGVGTHITSTPVTGPEVK